MTCTFRYIQPVQFWYGHHYLFITGGISKTDIRRFLYWAADHLGYTELRGVVAAPPSAELEPIREGEEAQTDEQDMGMTYDVSHLACSFRVCC